MARCEVCGKEGKLFLSNLEGSELQLCNSCSPQKAQRKQHQNKRFIPKRSYNKPEDTRRIVRNFSQIIQKARNKKLMSQEDFAKLLSERVSVIQKWESGALKPKLSTAKQLERTLNISIIEQENKNKEEKSEDPLEKHLPKGKKETLTMGDFIKIKTRKR